MSWAQASIGQWLLHSAVGGGTLMLLALAAMRWTRQPARRQRLGECGIVAALMAAVLSLAPAWLLVSVPASPPETPSAFQARNLGGPAVDTAHEDTWLYAAMPAETADTNASIAPTPPQALAESPPATVTSLTAAEFPWLTALIALYALGALFILGRWLFGYAALWRLLRTAGPAPEPVAQLLAAMTSGPRRPRLLVAPSLRVPLSCGLVCPTVVLPPALCDAPESELRWIFAHELTHLERRDPWTCLLFALGQAVFFYVPWFWVLRRQVQLCQEFVADASAVAVAEQRADYAEFLLNLTTAPLAPACATGVSGHTSDLFRRISMLLQNPFSVERRCPRLWSLATAGGLLSLAVLVAGVGLRADAAAPPDDQRVALAGGDDPTQKDEPKKDKVKKDGAKKKDKKDSKDDDEPKKEEKKLRIQINGQDIELPDIEEIIKNLPQNIDPEKLAEMRKQIEQARAEMRKRMEEFRKNMPEGFQGRFGGFRPGRMFAAQQGRLGVRVEAPSAVLTDQLDLPKGQGLVIEDVTPDSPAAKAGLKSHDILLQFNGKPVPSSPAEFAEALRDIKVDATVDLVVKRKGREEKIKGVQLPELKTEPKPRKRPGGIREFTPPAKTDAVFAPGFPGQDL
jgi:beta-lactamase regulating signal transducer with metallopeptidase domain